VRKKQTELFFLGPWLLLLLGDLLGLVWRLIDQGRSVAVFLALSDKGEPSAGHIEKGDFALGVGGLLRQPNTFRRVRSILSGVWHVHSPTRQKTSPKWEYWSRRFVPKLRLGQWKNQIRTKASELGELGHPPLLGSGSV
jgi:hypothetical protein